MALKFSLSALLFFTSTVLIAAPLPELATKQDVTNIRYLTRDGRYTYYQRRSGDLLLGTNFNVKEVIKGEVGTEYAMVGDAKGNWLVALQLLHYHQSYDPRLSGKVYRIKRGENSATELGEGMAIALQNNGSWVRFYNPHDKTISFKSLDNPQIGFNIKSPNKVNPFFIPDSVMPDDQTVLYVDMNEKGEVALIRFDRKEEKTKVLFKPQGINRRLELCHGFNKVYLGAFPYQQVQAKSEIWEVDKDKGLTKPIYSSAIADIGHMVCNHTENTIYFSKGFEQGKSVRYDIYALNTSDSSTRAISNLRYATQIVNHDGLLLIPFQGKYLVPIDQKQVLENQSLNSSSSGDKP